MKRKAPIIILALLASFLVPIMVGNVFASGCTTSCQVTASSNVPTGDGTIWIEIDNNTNSASTGNYCGSHTCIVSLPAGSPPTFNFANNTIQTITVLNNTFTGTSTQGHYVWKEWDNYYGNPAQTKWTSNPMLVVGPILYNYTGPAGFTAVFDKQYKYALTFKDVSGNSLSVPPDNVTLQAGTASPVTITAYSGQYLSSALYSVKTAFWERSKMDLSLTGQTVDMTGGPYTGSISLNAYPATIQILDTNNNPVQGANVTITLVNQTTLTLVSNSKGLVNLGAIPNGPFGATVHYQNQAYGPYSLTAVNNPTNTIKVSAAAPPTTTTTAIVLLAIFGLAFFLILLAIRVRKPSTPPTIR